MQPENTPEPFDWYANNADYSFLDCPGGNYVVPASAAAAAAGISSVTHHKGDSFAGSSLAAALFPEPGPPDSTPEARALEASKNHREAERRRRQRINSHLDSLRALLPCNSRTDKASLLAKVVSRLRELKEEASHQFTQTPLLPSESDEITLSCDPGGGGETGGRRLMIKASLCCEDRRDLIPDLIHTLKSLRLSPLRAEMVTLGGRVRNVLVLAGDLKDHSCADESMLFLRNALRSVVESAGGCEAAPKRPIMFNDTPM
ncbi:unnamed protein product [Cuscuta campestris]|uniref:BHLH domain-containing protein n=1 Tax=Cuscuta campestris TaxID=132261 RepID=A0A484MTK1_9ASTE|nr:unnamed protein product [Cuscuta campestris]